MKHISGEQSKVAWSIRTIISKLKNNLFSVWVNFASLKILNYLYLNLKCEKNSAESPRVDWSDIFPLRLPNNSPSVLICPSPVCFWRVCPRLPPLSSPAGLLLLMQGCSQLPAVIRPVLGSPENKMLLLAPWTRSVSVTSPPASFFYTSFLFKPCLHGEETCASSQRSSVLCPSDTEI